MIPFPTRRAHQLATAALATSLILPSVARGQTSTLPPTDISNQHPAPGAGAPPPQPPPPGYAPEAEPILPAPPPPQPPAPRTRSA